MYMTLAALALLAAFAAWRMQIYRVRLIQNVDDDEFATYCKGIALDPLKATLERAEIAQLLGVPARKLGPEMRLSDIVGRDIAARVGLGDLEFNLNTMASQAGVRLEQVPSRIVDLIRLRLELKSAPRT